MGVVIKCRTIRIECDNVGDDVFHYKMENVGDFAGHTYPECFKAAKNDGWVKIKGKWTCPRCS